MTEPLQKDKFSFTIDSLRSAKKNKRLSHAYIVYSDDPEIRRNFVLILAQIILCPEKDINSVPCGVCESCRKIEKGIYPDLYILEPTSKTRKIVIGEDSDDPDTIRWFQARFSLTGMSGSGKKIGIIHDADRITVQGQNAFLKNLEEPPRSSYFILSSGNPHTLLPTVLSRCQMMPLLTNKCTYSFADSTSLFDLLLRMVSVPKKSLSYAVDFAEKLVVMFDNLHKEAETTVAEKWKERLDNLENLGSATARNQVTERYKAAIEGEYRLLREYFLSAIYSWFAQVFQATCGVDSSLQANPEIISNYIESDIKLSQSEAVRFLNKTEKFVNNLNWNINETLAIQEFCINVTVK